MNFDKILSDLRARVAKPGPVADMRTLPAHGPYCVVSMEIVRDSERFIRATFPALLTRIYTEVANGGFGPGAGLLGLDGGYVDSDGRTLIERYEHLCKERWRERLLPLFDWGDGSWSCADTSTPAGVIVTADAGGYTETQFDLAMWFSSWLEGVDLHSEIYEIEEAEIVNPFTHKLQIVKRRANAKGKLLSAL